ncbi:uncharacterized protein LOC119400369 [Rhipicephalus sanguineus]|uniref:Uncharacterized protein n=1 Tax=Rhipicephalus sanguineus TaxID=34632 RepID=A0A9D4SQ49_RHISA|nr:uncharacterized protein LOC119400369 [Rhipicephalus sanguineus]KAH7942970.1 hypothetical protein HPB52_002745 [Rhipicephalus sanguineus]
MDAVTAVVCVTASLATVWCVSEAYLRYIYSKRVVEGTLPSDARRLMLSRSYGTLVDACQEMTPSYGGNRLASTDEGTLNAVLIVEDSKPPPYDHCLLQESEPPPYVECLPGE